LVKVKLVAKVITIERAQNVLTIERVVELFSAAFGHVCALKVLNSSEMFYTQFDRLFIRMSYEISGHSKSKAGDSHGKVGEAASVAV
jgi:hypothetical protein